ncbi:succinate dehydrogenase, cytochrome b556 subunit [Octadecabacter sp. 1_MG-2023]|uniref:succinate dehydrogenase, cytochrome b556 subunit n=1 Tax=unclassified Octadecabacter TaxID=196158 RepID=UPI001C097C90|nr:MULTISPECIES: succinate dehydrogenase, cytochrome b556 subunit [unclassified Octadecabacter]MBU2991779.1 succinate dehydrogenase, cytochrome b556 subunit [Octadecabacter sp. B2R22]MDO6735752.1 succinate dehydrogenase, cytochrome b556 subunit [Octadecabacter sp. 1_MG-2023]
MADVNRGNRPLSPHLSIYRPQLTSMTSIFTRLTGNALIVGALLAVWWFVALAAGPVAYARANGFITSWFGDLIMFGSVACIWYHMLAGIRHLVWDSGHMLDVERSELAGMAIIIVSVLLTIFTVIVL